MQLDRDVPKLPNGLHIEEPNRVCRVRNESDHYE